ncbi:MAG: hypothetical protein WCA13_08055 [Terriglobales bacterium]
MPSNRYNLILDEQTFQGLLFAAFIVQEYNDRVNKDRTNGDQLNNGRTKAARPQRVEPETRPAAEFDGVCPHCGAPKATEGSRCESCGREEFRPGERLQRNWASMWLMSQEQDVWPVRSTEARESARKDFPAPAAERRPLPYSAHDSASSGLIAQPVAGEMPVQERSGTVNDPARDRSARDKSAMSKSGFDAPAFDAPALNDRTPDAPALDKPDFHKPVLDDPAQGKPASGAQALSQAEAESKSSTATINEVVDEATDHLTREDLAHEDTDLAVHTFQLSADDSSPIEASEDESGELISDASGDSDAGTRPWRQRLADLRVTLRFQRSNLYLAVAVLVAALAVLWPAAGSPRQAALSPWERALVTLGLAEAPEPAVHVQGDPAIEVWIDPHTALYYCPGEEQYGKTADGRLSSQREAQMDRFEPAGHLACE